MGGAGIFRIVDVMEDMTIMLISVIEDRGNVRARLRAEASGVGVRVWLEVCFAAPPGSSAAALAEEAYDRALKVLDPA